MWVESQVNPEREYNIRSAEGIPEKKLDMSLEGDKHRSQIMQPTLPDLNVLTRRTSHRQHKPSFKAHGSQDKVVQRMFGLATNGNRCRAKKQSPIMTIVTHLQNIQSLFDDSINECHFYVFNAVASTNDVYTLKEMLKLKDVRPFEEAMMKEINDHEERDHWMLMKRLDMPKGARFFKLKGCQMVQ